MEERGPTETYTYSKFKTLLHPRVQQINQSSLVAYDAV